MNGRRYVLVLCGLLAGGFLAFLPQTALAAPAIPSVNIGIGQANGPQDVSVTLQIMALLTILTLAPSILIMTTSFVLSLIHI